MSWRRADPSSRQRFNHHGVVQGQVQQVEDQHNRRKRHRLQEIRPQG